MPARIWPSRHGNRAPNETNHRGTETQIFVSPCLCGYLYFFFLRSSWPCPFSVISHVSLLAITRVATPMIRSGETTTNCHSVGSLHSLLPSILATKNPEPLYVFTSSSFFMSSS